MDNDDHRGLADSLQLTVDEIKNSGDMNVQTVPDDKPTEEAAKIEGSKIQHHPFADMFPMMKGEDFAYLVTSIKEDGQEEPIVIFEEKILDGRNRYAACTEAKVETEFVEYEGGAPLEFVLRKNLHRRHLITSQRSIIAAKMANMSRGERTDIEPPANLQKVSVAEAAEKFNVSPRSVETAKVVLTSGDDELIEAVESGKMAVSAAAKKVTQAITSPSKPTGTPLTEAEEQSQMLLKLWNKTGEEGHALFLEAIGATT
jgi:ParB-like chromosome segregation protein Spo0J